MTFIEQFENDFVQKLDHLNYGKTDEREVVRWASERILESYRNGITAGQKGATVKRKGESRRRGIYGKAE